MKTRTFKKLFTDVASMESAIKKRWRNRMLVVAMFFMFFTGCPDSPLYEVDLPNSLVHCTNGGERGFIAERRPSGALVQVYPSSDDMFCNQLVVAGQYVLGCEVEHPIGEAHPSQPLSYFSLNTIDLSIQSFEDASSFKEHCRNAGLEFAGLFQE